MTGRDRSGTPDFTPPGGGVYDWYVRGMSLLESGHPAAAAQLLSHAADAEPSSRCVREALARAQFDSGQYAAAAENFRRIVEINPAEHYAQFGLGLACARVGELRTAVGHLAIAAAMRPDVHHYRKALRGARATLAHQRE